jgi:hypothetical protein
MLWLLFIIMCQVPDVNKGVIHESCDDDTDQESTSGLYYLMELCADSSSSDSEENGMPSNKTFHWEMEYECLEFIIAEKSSYLPFLILNNFIYAKMVNKYCLCTFSPPPEGEYM